jgi:hypothetical protein
MSIYNTPYASKHRGYMKELAMKKVLSTMSKKRSIFCRFENGKLRVGSASKHRTPQARMWRTCIRMTRHSDGMNSKNLVLAS